MDSWIGDLYPNLTLLAKPNAKDRRFHQLLLAYFPELKAAGTYDSIML